MGAAAVGSISSSLAVALPAHKSVMAKAANGNNALDCLPSLVIVPSPYCQIEDAKPMIEFWSGTLIDPLMTEHNTRRIT